MEIEEAVLLRVFVGEDKRHGDMPLYEAIALKAREMHLLGATVLNGRLGFGRSTRLHTTRALLSEDLPLVIEIVDEAEKIDALYGCPRGHAGHRAHHPRDGGDGPRGT